ncbi:Uncharacterised protein [uncultured archaeon]|nr:Uncharacterised protein [uncultured archaeon]
MLNKTKSPERKKKKIAFKSLRIGLRGEMSKEQFELKRFSELEAGKYCLERAVESGKEIYFDGNNNTASANYFLSATFYEKAALASVALSQPRAAFKYFYKASKYYSKSIELSPEKNRLEYPKRSRKMADICVYEAARRFLRNYRATIGLHARIDRLK